eukprot:UN15909
MLPSILICETEFFNPNTKINFYCSINITVVVYFSFP